MIPVLLLVFLHALECDAVELPASQWSIKEYQNLTLRQHRVCVENEQYLHQGLCCLNCKAGKDHRSERTMQLCSNLLAYIIAIHTLKKSQFISIISSEN